MILPYAELESFQGRIVEIELQQWSAMHDTENHDYVLYVCDCLLAYSGFLSSGYWLGSSLPTPAGWRLASSSVNISNQTFSLP